MANLTKISKQQILAIIGIWALILICKLAASGFPVTHGTLMDSDDYMRMVRVFDIIDGKGTPSHFEPRMGVDGSEMGWSRLADWPLVPVQAALEIFMPRIDAAMVTATIMPAMALMLFLWAVLFYVRPVLGLPVTFFMYLAVMLQWILLRQFLPGRVDHHMWQILLCVLGYAGIIRVYYNPALVKAALLSGVAFGFGLAIGADIVPWLAAAGAMLSWFWFMAGRDYERALLYFGIGVGVTTALLYLIFTPFDRLSYMACDALSPFWVSLALAVTAFCGIIYGVPARWKEARIGRFLCGVVIAGGILAVLVGLFHRCIFDPYMIEDDILRVVWLNHVGEARSIATAWVKTPVLAKMLAIPFALGVVASVAAYFYDQKNRLLWSGIAIVLAFGTLLAFYQIRTMDFSMAISLLPLMWFLGVCADIVKALLQRMPPYMTLALSVIIFIGGAVLALSSYVTDDHAAVKSGQNGQVVADAQDVPEEGADQDICDNRAYVMDVLNTLPAGQVVAAHMDLGGAILFHTPHRAFGGPYHRNEKGMLAAYYIFAAPSAERARELAGESGATVLVVCAVPKNYWVTVSPEEGLFVEDLIAGQIPSWLEPVGDPEEKYKIFKVIP